MHAFTLCRHNVRETASTQASAHLVAKVKTVEEVRLVCSSTSVFLAAVENATRQRVSHTVRRPTTAAERAHNAMRALQELSALLKYDLSHISGERIVQGSLEDIVNTLEILAAVAKGAQIQGATRRKLL